MHLTTGSGHCAKMAVLLLIATTCCTNVVASASSNADDAPPPLFDFKSGNAAYDNAYKLAMREMSLNIEHGIFIAGEGWKQLWTRDTSFAVELAAGLVHPQVAKRSLQKCIETDEYGVEVWLQDSCGHFEGWPNLSDAIVGARGAWSLYLVTGDVDFLSWAYTITVNSLARAERDAYDASTGLFLGCSSFMESNSGYPQKYHFNGSLVGQTKALSTNMLHYAGYKIGAQMARVLSKDTTKVRQLENKATKLQKAIRSRLWLTQQGYYSYFEDEHDLLVPHWEGLGEALVLLEPDFEPNHSRIDSIFHTTHREHGGGLPCLWPPFEHSNVKHIEDFYHNGRIWPFVQGYWSMAAARHERSELIEQELSSLQLLSQRGNTFAEFYELNGAFEQTRTRQLWSDAGFLSMIYNGLFGLTFTTNGIVFHPCKPTGLFDQDTTISLRRVRYRKALLDIHVHGAGCNVESFMVDGELLKDPFVPINQRGKHTIEMTLSNADGISAEVWGADQNAAFSSSSLYATSFLSVMAIVGVGLVLRNGSAIRLYHRLSTKDENEKF